MCVCCLLVLVFACLVDSVSEFIEKQGLKKKRVKFNKNLGAFSGLLLETIVSSNQMGFVMVFAVLCDTFIVRPFLTPSMLSLVDTINFWPTKVPTQDLRGVDGNIIYGKYENYSFFTKNDSNNNYNDNENNDNIKNHYNHDKFNFTNSDFDEKSSQPQGTPVKDQNKINSFYKKQQPIGGVGGGDGDGGVGGRMGGVAAKNMSLDEQSVSYSQKQYNKMSYRQTDDV